MNYVQDFAGTITHNQAHGNLICKGISYNNQHSLDLDYLGVYVLIQFFNFCFHFFDHNRITINDVGKYFFVQKFAWK